MVFSILLRIIECNLNLNHLNFIREKIFIFSFILLRYGYITNTKIKFIIIIESNNQQYHDTEIKIVIEKFIYFFSSSLVAPSSTLTNLIKFLSFSFLNMQLFKKLHNAYISAVCNPFYTPGEKIKSK